MKWLFFLFLVLVSAFEITFGDQLYPISQAEDVLRKQPHWSSADELEPVVTSRRADGSDAVLSDARQDDADLAWFKTNIVDKYGFRKDSRKDMWTSQPNFRKELGTKQFTAAAERVKSFFKRNNDWARTKTNSAFRSSRECTNLLYITAARYLFVTHILYLQSGKKLTACSRSRDNKIVIPSSGVCYPEPYGTASCTSDYDVGLIGKDAGTLTFKFNNYFESRDGFGKPSELVFDTNVYAFTLEFAMPFLFSGLPSGFAGTVEREEKTTESRMQELASAYYKVYKYNEGFFNKMVSGANKAFKRQASQLKTKLATWLNRFDNLDRVVALKGLRNLRQAHNGKYQALMKTMSTSGGYTRPEQAMGKLAEALLYAAEAYHSRGAIRHVVGGTQMKVVDNQKSLSTNDLWASLVENWGECNKEYDHCSGIPVEECFLKMSKYMWRMLQAMKILRTRLSPNGRAGLVNFADPLANPEILAAMWLDYKKSGKSTIPKYSKHLHKFLSQFGCTSEQFGRPLSAGCVSKMNDKVNMYNIRLAGEASDTAHDEVTEDFMETGDYIESGEGDEEPGDEY